RRTLGPAGPRWIPRHPGERRGATRPRRDRAAAPSAPPPPAGRAEGSRRPVSLPAPGAAPVARTYALLSSDYICSLYPRDCPAVEWNPARSLFGRTLEVGPRPHPIAERPRFVHPYMAAASLIVTSPERPERPAHVAPT